MIWFYIVSFLVLGISAGVLVYILLKLKKEKKLYADLKKDFESLKKINENLSKK